MSSVREIAKRVGVSGATVSRVLNNHPTVDPELRERVLAEVNRSRYAGATGRAVTTNVALVYLETAPAAEMLRSPFDVALLQGMAENMAEEGYNLMILDAGKERLPGENFTQMFHRRGVRAAVIRGASRDRQLVEDIAAEGFPSVAIAERFDDGDANRVSFVRGDSASTSRAAVDRLLELGHRRIGICLHRIADDDHLDRYNAYTDALRDAGVRADPSWVFRIRALRESGATLLDRLAGFSEPLTAVFVTDPIVAAAALREASVRGIRVPEDLSILGFDDAELRLDTHPEMTAVCQDAWALGRTATAVALRLLADSTRPPERHVLPTFFSEGGSIGPVPSAAST